MAISKSVRMRHGDLKDEITVPARTAKVLEQSGWKPVEEKKKAASGGRGGRGGTAAAKKESASGGESAASAADKKES